MTKLAVPLLGRYARTATVCRPSQLHIAVLPRHTYAAVAFFWFLQIIYAVNEVIAMLQDESNFVSANIYSQPPQNGNDTDEDSGSEDSGVTVDNLTEGLS